MSVLEQKKRKAGGCRVWNSASVERADQFKSTAGAGMNSKTRCGQRILA